MHGDQPIAGNNVTLVSHTNPAAATLTTAVPKNAKYFSVNAGSEILLVSLDHPGSEAQDFTGAGNVLRVAANARSERMPCGDPAIGGNAQIIVSKEGAGNLTKHVGIIFEVEDGVNVG